MAIAAEKALEESKAYIAPTYKPSTTSSSTIKASSGAGAGCISSSTSSSHWKPSEHGGLKKDGTLDMRMAANKAHAVASIQSSSYSTPSYSSSSYGGGRSSGISSSYGGGVSSSSTSGGSLSGYTGRVTAAGNPDMRTTAGKAWAAANK